MILVIFSSVLYFLQNLPILVVGNISISAACLWFAHFVLDVIEFAVFTLTECPFGICVLLTIHIQKLYFL